VQRLEAIVSRWGSISEAVAFRRFCVAFMRLHEHMAPAEEDRIGLRASTPMEYLILCTLHAEKIFQERYLFAHGGIRSLPRNNRTIFLEAVREMLNARGRDLACEVEQGVRELEGVLKTKDQLHDLKVNPRDPFIALTDIAFGDEATKQILVSCGNLVILRNYVAHHDVLDREMIYDPKIAKTAIQAVLIPTLLVLGLAPGAAQLEEETSTMT